MNVPAEEIISHVRDIMPARPVSLGEALIVAELQAIRLLQVFRTRRVPVDLTPVHELPKIEVKMVSRHELKANRAAASTCEPGGHWLVLINRNQDVVERRATIAHELKHILDYSVRGVAYVGLGFGDNARRREHIEQICDHFAGCFLVPRVILKRAWLDGIRDIEALAEFFEVPEATIITRLRYLGLSDGGRQPLETYFRRSATGMVHGQSLRLAGSMA